MELYIDFDSEDFNPLQDVDVCILGAGAAGIVLATQLVAKGCSVVLIEAGGLGLELRSQSIYRSEVAGRPYDGSYLGRFRTFGGSSTQWGGQILELTNSTFSHRPHVGNSGWPFAREELEPYYRRALEFEGLSGARRHDELVGVDLGLDQCEVGPEFSLLYSRHCGQLDFSQHAALSQATQLSIVYHANVVGFRLNESKTAIESAKVIGYGGRSSEISAKYFTICLGGIETTRLLLQPPPAGRLPWQTNGFLGRHFQDHILLECIPLLPLGYQPFYKYFGCTFVGGYQYRPHFRLSDEAQSRHETLDIAGTINAYQVDIKAKERASRMLREALRGRRPMISSTSDLRHLPDAMSRLLFRRLFGENTMWKKVMLTLHCEQHPFSSSEIILGEKRDRFGMHVARIDWRISDQEIHTLKTFARLAGEVFSRGGVAQVVVSKEFFEDKEALLARCVDSYHHMGGTRMSASSSNGVVDKNLKLYGVANAYVCSCSVFPSAGFSNPTHTLLALAMRLSDHLSGLARTSY